MKSEIKTETAYAGSSCDFYFHAGGKMNFRIEYEREEDGRWIAEVARLPGVLAYGATKSEAMSKAEVLALRVLAERLERNESRPRAISISFAPA